MKTFLSLLMALSLCSCASIPSNSFAPSKASQTVQNVSVSVPLSPAIADIHPTLSPVTMPYTKADVDCLSEAMYFEARGEGDKGLEAVGYVVTNRVESQRFPGSICEVVHQGVTKNGHMVRNRCQFGWYCDGAPEVIHDQKTYEHCRDLAKLILLKVAPNPIGHCLFFHEEHVRIHPHRRYAYQKRVGHQIFYNLVAVD